MPSGHKQLRLGQAEAKSWEFHTGWQGPERLGPLRPCQKPDWNQFQTSPQGMLTSALYAKTPSTMLTCFISHRPLEIRHQKNNSSFPRSHDNSDDNLNSNVLLEYTRYCVISRVPGNVNIRSSGNIHNNQVFKTY